MQYSNASKKQDSHPCVSLTGILLSPSTVQWHLGSHTRAVTPTQRGFLSHSGYWTGHEDYYDHTAQELYGPVVSGDTSLHFSLVSLRAVIVCLC